MIFIFYYILKLKNHFKNDIFLYILKIRVNMANTGSTSFNSPDSSQLKEQVDKAVVGIDKIRVKPTISIDLTKYFLTDRQIMKKIIMVKSPGITEENAQLIVYGKLYYKDDKLYDNDKLDPNCVLQPTDEDYAILGPSLDENSPIGDEIKKMKEESIQSVKELGIKLQELIVAQIQCLTEIISAITSIAASIAIMPPGSGLPVAFASLQTMLSSIKRLQSKVGEILPYLKPLEYLTLLLPASASGVISLVSGILVVLNTTTLGDTGIAGVLSKLTGAGSALPTELPKQELKIEPKATKPLLIRNIDKETTLKAGATGGDWQYTYSWSSDPVGFDSVDSEPTVSPMSTTIYYVKVKDSTGQTKDGQITIEVI
jgi:hypothetical protein